MKFFTLKIKYNNIITYVDKKRHKGMKPLKSLKFMVAVLFAKGLEDKRQKEGERKVWSQFQNFRYYMANSVPKSLSKWLGLKKCWNQNNLVNHNNLCKISHFMFTLQWHSPVVLLQSLWKPLFVSQSQGPHIGLPHQPWGHGFLTLSPKIMKHWFKWLTSDVYILTKKIAT